MTSSLASAVVSCAVNSVWEVPVIFAAAWAVVHLQKRIGPRAQHITWVAALVLAVLTPALSLCRAVAASFSLPHAVAGRTSIVIATAQSMGASSKGVFLLPAVVIFVLFSGYVCTLLYFAGRLIWSLCWTAALLRDSNPVLLNAAQMELWRRCKQTFSLKDVSRCGRECLFLSS